MKNNTATTTNYGEYQFPVRFDDYDYSDLMEGVHEVIEYLGDMRNIAIRLGEQKLARTLDNCHSAIMTFCTSSDGFQSEKIVP
jgi:hypothetical protein